MTKAKTKAARRRQKRAAVEISLPGGATIRQAPKGRDRRHTNQPDSDLPPIYAKRRSDSDDDEKSPLHATDMGRCILALTDAGGDDRRHLSDAWAALSAAHANYRARIIGINGNPKGAATLVISEAMETDQSYRVDLRTADERDEAARRAWAAWEASMKALPVPQLHWALRGALEGFLGEGRLWNCGARQPTVIGRNAVAALRIVADA